MAREPTRTQVLIDAIAHDVEATMGHMREAHDRLTDLQETASALGLNEVQFDQRQEALVLYLNGLQRMFQQSWQGIASIDFERDQSGE